MAAVGRPSDYTPEIATLICERMMDGESLRKICMSEGMPDKVTVLRWIREREEFRNQYAKAREVMIDGMAIEILEIADDGSNDTYTNDDGHTVTHYDIVTRSRLRVDTRKWLMSKLLPKKYGDKVVTEHTGPDGGPVQVSDVSLTQEQREAMAIAVLKEAGRIK